jgi:hypothetical protein
VKGKHRGRCLSSGLDFSRVLVQQHYVIDFGADANLSPVLIMWFGPLVAPSNSDFTIGQFGGTMS